MKAPFRFYPALLLVSFFFLAMPLFGDQGDPPGRVVRLSYMQGAVSFEPAGENDWSQATLNYPLTTGDRLWTDNGAEAELETGNVAIRMAPQTDLTATNLTDDLIQLGLAQGSLRVRVFDLRPGHSIEVDTSSAAITIVQPGSYRVDTYPDQTMTLVTVNSGEVQVTGNGVNQTVQGGQAAQLTGSNPPQLNWVTVPGPDSFDQWSDQRDQKYLRAQARQYVSPEVPGYYDLDGYGSWSTVAEYGPIWYPSSVAVGWCPYRYGRWVWVEPWGWTWLDDAPWGFAPFHYGRWVQVGPRWGWLPGPIAVAPIYGPAFVAFVGGPQFSVSFGVGGVAAWFPLGPGEPFYPWYHHSDVYLRQINVTNVRNINVTNITNVTNINNIHYRYQTVATTAVSANAFRNAEPVVRNMVRVNPQQIARATVIPHPQINPTPKAIAAGSKSTRPPVPAQRPAIVQHPPVANVHPGQPPNTAKNTPPENVRPGGVVHPNETPHPNQPPPSNTNEARTPPSNQRPGAEPPATHETPPVANNNRPAPPSQEPRTPPATTVNRPPEGRPASSPPPSRPALVARTPPPPEKLPLQQKAPVMEQHPGRPLEPQQRANLSAGRPAGPMMDSEFPPHANPVRPASPPHSAPPAHSGEPHH